ncbi:MAG: hypothetical protein JWR50_1920 [Mucilaginibacter sp.]|nr:hypothetical protein [Mucilaginibacter sp.]
MKKSLFIFCFFLITVKVFGQQFSQYNTGSLYESFENPSQRAFIPDTTRQFAFNFFIPNFTANLFVAGNGQEALKTRAFSSYYNTANLLTGKGGYNHININANAYSIMFKVYASENGDEELGFSLNTKAEAKGIFTDETISLFNAYTNFPQTSYSNLFNDNYYYQAYNQIGFTYREQVTKRFAFGIKLNALSGIAYRQTTVDHSSVTFDKEADEATIFAQGKNYASIIPNGTSNKQVLLPTFLNPGASISIGTSYLDDNGYKWQGNLKDLGFIHWNSKSTISEFNGSGVVTGFSTSNRENNIFNRLDSLTSNYGNTKVKGFNTPTNGLLEVSVNKTYWLSDDFDKNFKFSPTLIASKELFYSGFTGALVTPVQYGKYIVSLTTTYNDLKLLGFGGQFMFKANNAEFFIGSERAYQTALLARRAIRSETNAAQPQRKVNLPGYSGMDIFLGVSFKFGPDIEHRLNSSSIPMGDKGFVGRIWDGIFHKDHNY